jgi:hypothetical protein
MLELQIYVQDFPLAPVDTPQSALPLDGSDGLCARQRVLDAKRTFAVANRA